MLDRTTTKDYLEEEIKKYEEHSRRFGDYVKLQKIQLNPTQTEKLISIRNQAAPIVLSSNINNPELRIKYGQTLRNLNNEFANLYLTIITTSLGTPLGTLTFFKSANKAIKKPKKPPAIPEKRANSL